MSLVNSESREIVAQLTEAEARDLTNRIREAAEKTYALLLEAHERGAWIVLGYASWREYATTEFGMSQSHAYRILDHGRVAAEIGAAAGSPIGEISEYDARQIKPHLTTVTNAIREQVADADPERVAEIVKGVIVEERERIKRERAENQAVRSLNDLAPPGFDAESDQQRILLYQSMFRAIDTLLSMPPPEQVVAIIPDYSADRLANIETAAAWLDDFAVQWEESR